MVLFEDEKGQNTLAIQHPTQPNGEGNYISFLEGTDANPVYLGGVKRYTQSNVSYLQFETKAGDYAEYLEKLDPSEFVEAGDIVGVFKGKVSKRTKGADQVLVISSAPAVAGNFPEKSPENYGLAAFFGQVQVKVKGVVKRGDFIIPSGDENGFGIALPLSQMTAAQKAKIVGQAWGSKSHKKTGSVLVAVGFSFSQPNFESHFIALTQLEDKVVAAQAEKAELEIKLDQLIESQEKELDQLLKEVQSLKDTL